MENTSKETNQNADSAKVDENIESFSPMEDKANEIVKNYMLWTTVIGLIPVPVIDGLGLTGLQLHMLYKLANLYSVQFSKNAGKFVIASLVGGYGATSASRYAGASLLKSIPFIGNISSVLFVEAFSIASTYAIGKVFIQHFESGGTFLNFNPEETKEYFKEQFEIGKKRAKNAYSTIMD